MKSAVPSPPSVTVMKEFALPWSRLICAQLFVPLYACSPFVTPGVAVVNVKHLPVGMSGVSVDGMR